MALDKVRLGAAIKAKVQAALAAHISQGTDPADYQTYQTALYEGIAEAIIDEIKNNATIESLSANQTPAGQGPHTHNVSTVESTGKIK